MYRVYTQCTQPTEQTVKIKFTEADRDKDILQGMYNFKNETCLPAGDHLASVIICLSISLSHYCVSLPHTQTTQHLTGPTAQRHNGTFVSPLGVSFVCRRLPKGCFLPTCSLVFCKNTVPPRGRM